MFSKFFTALLLLASTAALAQFDNSHKAFDELLKKHVVYISNGNASQVSYAGFAKDRAALKTYLDAISAVPEATYKAWSKPQQLSFLINAYNAYTIELILTKYPNLKSIRDLGGTFSKPWSLKFFKLFGKDTTLDNIEHDMIRADGVFNDPRIHVAVVCASIGCPMLRNEVFTAERLDAQLDDGMKRFFSDRTRNRYNAESKKLEINKIFDWYKKDFVKGHKGFASLEGTLGKYADQLADDPAARAAIKAGTVSISYLDYDWNLNDKK
ncbi:MAG: DUF547 domain-containing protein [Betaproteobacteria bacterium]|nr:MAG: DUF547 domain-containing protein [Betaproteobacteria bacterium]